MRTTSMRPMLCFLAALTVASAGCSADSSRTTLLSPSVDLSIEASLSPTRVVLNPAAATIAVAATQQLTPTAYNKRGLKAPRATFTYVTLNPAVATVSSSGLVTGVAPGTAKIVVVSGKVSDNSTITVTAPPPPPPPSSYTYCVAAGNVCVFTGLRDVRLVAANGAFVSQEAFGMVPCATYGFGNQNPGPSPLFCDYGPVKTTLMDNPMPGMGGLPAVVTVPLGAPGANGPRIQSTTYSGTPNYSGSFRTQCYLSKFAFDDPIVYPGQPGASHLHLYFGNTAVDANTTPASLASSGNSTCRGGTLNRSAYWVPAVFDTRTGTAVTPDVGTFYYKTGYNVDPRVITTLPAGLRMIAGDKNATGLQQHVYWECTDVYTPPSATMPTSCGVAVRLVIIFPQCWDGVNLDAADHKSHMAYPVYRNPPQVSSCPPTHPITLPEITELIDFPITPASTPAFWRLSSDMYSASLPGGMSAHADWMNGWDPATILSVVTQCLNKSMDCGVGAIGGGKELIW